MILLEEGTDRMFIARNTDGEVIFKSKLDGTFYKDTAQLFAKSLARANGQVVRICYDSGDTHDIHPV